MGLYVIAELSLIGLLNQVWLVVEVAIAIGAVIFVHELGHFAVAKWSGVKCEKFYLGFDIFGLKLLKFRYGETEYGIGILPLGGYVKMLGQEDNPARAAEEIERAKQRRAQPDAESDAETDAETEFEGFDPRSYQAQSVPKRMAIISAGVVMNIIFAFVVAVVAYWLGVDYIPAEISRVLPGSAAWRAGLEPGDQIVRIGDVENPRYTDLKSEIVLSNLEQGVDLSILRQGREKPFSVHLVPDPKGGERLMPTIGVLPPQSLELSPVQPTWPDSPADRVEPKIQPGDRIVEVDGRPIETYPQWLKILTHAADQPLQVTVETKSPSDGQSTGTQRRTARLPPHAMRVLGLSMTPGPITAIEQGSPAEKSGIEVGDQLLEIDGQPIGDPLRLADRLEKQAGKTVTLTLQRKGQGDPLKLPLTVRNVDYYDWPVPIGDDDSPMSVPQLGIAYGVEARIAEIDPGGPAAEGGLSPGDRIVEASFILPKETGEDSDVAQLFSRVTPVDFRGNVKRYGWTGFFFSWLQHLPDGSQVELVTEDQMKVRLTPVPATDWFNPERGFNFRIVQKKRTATSLSDAAALGLKETVNFISQVYVLIEKLVGNQVSSKVLGGPLTIISAAGGAAERGLPELLMFLGMLSANLAVINFLPIPVLDGGHMMFLLIEGIRGKPAGEKLTIALHYAGFLLILMLMAFVLFLDVKRLGG